MHVDYRDCSCFSVWSSFSLYFYDGQNVSTNEKYKKYSGIRLQVYVKKATQCQYPNALFATFHIILY